MTVFNRFYWLIKSLLLGMKLGLGPQQVQFMDDGVAAPILP